MQTIIFGESKKDEMMRSVERIVRAKARDRNLFAWQEYIEDVLSGVALYMWETNFSKSIGIYANYATQGLLDHNAWANAQKRRGNFDRAMKIGFEEIPVDVGGEDKEFKEADLMLSIESEFGEKVAEAVKPILGGMQVTKKMLNELGKLVDLDRFRRMLKGYAT